MTDQLIQKIHNQMAQGFDAVLSNAIQEGVGITSMTYSNSDGVSASSLKYEDIIKAKELILESQQKEPVLPRIIETPHMTERVLTKKPRKKKNRRWDKKYWKKYSRVQPMKNGIHDKINNNIYVNPDMLRVVWNMFYGR